jgi:formylglycine-generating enzyme required for sulfatase activity
VSFDLQDSTLTVQWTTPVGSFRPNAFELYDTAGNAAEWVEDCWNLSYRAAPNDGSAWTSGDCSLAFSAEARSRTRRFLCAPRRVFVYDEDVRYYPNGFRMARDLD